MIRIGLCDNKYISLEILEKAINECMVELNVSVRRKKEFEKAYQMFQVNYG